MLRFHRRLARRCGPMLVSRNHGVCRPIGPGRPRFPTGADSAMLRRWISQIGRLRRAGRRTNMALLVVLLAAAASGGVAFAAGTPVPAKIATLAHGIFGLALVLLVPWKTMIVRRAPVMRATSLILVALIGICLA